MFALIGAIVGLIFDILAIISLSLFVIVAPFVFVAYVVSFIREKGKK